MVINFDEIGNMLDVDNKGRHNLNFQKVKEILEAMQTELNNVKSNLAPDLTAYLKSVDADTKFASKTHTHSISDVTNLQSTLDGKAATNHTHTIANITGLQTVIDGKSDKTYVDNTFLKKTDQVNVDLSAYAKTVDVAPKVHTHDGKDILDGTLGLVKTTFKKSSSNIAELSDLVNNTYLDGTKGTETTSEVYKTSDFVAVTPGDLILLAYVRSYAFYDADKVYITGAANAYYLQPYVSPHTEVPANAAYIKYSVQQDNFNQFALMKNDYMYSDKRKYVVDKRYIEDILLTDIKGLIPSKNLFDKTKIETYRLIKSDLTIASGSGYNVSRLIPLEAGQPYTFTKVHSVVYYNDKFIAQKYIANPTTITENYPYIRVNVQTINLDLAQVEKGTVATPYAAFSEKKIPNELLPSNLGGTAYDQSLNKADNVTFNKVTAKVIEADSIISPATLPKGTLTNPPSGLVSGDMWADTTDSATHPILRVMM